MPNRLAPDAGPESVRAGSGADSDRYGESGDEHRGDTGALGGAPIGRRAWLKTMSGIAATSAVGAQVVSADNEGYGAGEYGSGPYGDPETEDDDDEGSVAVETRTATVDDQTATLSGALTELEGYTEAQVYFEWDERGDELDNTTAPQTVESNGEFDDQLNDLERDTEYAFCAVVEAGDDIERGDTLLFEVGGDDGDGEDQLDSDPEIVELKVEDTSNSRNPHVDVTIEWEASIEEGELGAAEVTVSDSDGEVLSWEYDLSGQTAERSEEERIHHGSGETYTVKLTVHSGHDTTESERITIES